MPTVKLSKRMLLELLGRKVSDSELSSKINFLGTNCESILDDEITVEVFPNRPDLLSEHGMARALKTFMGIKPGFTNYILKKSPIKVIIDKSVKNIRPYTACAVVRNLKLTDEKIKEIIQIQEKLHVTYCRNRKKAAIGIYPLEHIKPPIYYKALHPQEIRFKPLDLNKELTGAQILAIHPTGREYAHLMDGLEKYAIFIDSKASIMSMPPIINSNTVGKVSVTTKEVFVECSGFDLEYLKTCLNIIVASLIDIGGEAQTVELHYPDKKLTTPDLSGWELKLSIEYANKILGLDLKEGEIKSLLARMGHEYKSGKVRVPSYRADILHPIDIVEDIAIAYDYNALEGVLPNVATTAHESSLESFKRKLREILSNTGLIEVKNYHLTDISKQTKLMNFHSEIVELETATEYNSLRTWITPCLLETLKYNKHYDYPQNIFEIGTVFKPNEGFETHVQETEHLAVALCANDANFTKAKQIIDTLFEGLGMNYAASETEHQSFIKGRVARVLLNDEKIAYFGEIHPQIILNWDLEMPVAVIELNITELFRILHKGKIEQATNINVKRQEDSASTQKRFAETSTREKDSKKIKIKKHLPSQKKLSGKNHPKKAKKR